MRLSERAKKQARYAGRLALNDSANLVKGEIVKDFGYGFDRPTLWTMRAPVAQYAKGDDLNAAVSINGASVNGRTFTNKQGRAQINTLRPHFEGGSRETKAFERAFQRVGLMPRGWFAVPGACATSVGAMDNYGNIKASFINQMISYFCAFGEQGYRANMTDKRKAKLAKIGSGDGFRKIGGVVYFISRGRGFFFGNGTWQHGRSQHLTPGIWAKTGIHGCDIKPVIVFVSSAHYRQRFDIHAGADRVMADFQRVFSGRFAQAMSTAR